MNISEHFSLQELTHSDIALRRGIDNTPTVSVLENLEILADGLESVRTILGNQPLLISSGFRCLTLNKLLGSASYSAHVMGLAADFTSPSFGTPLEVASAIAKSDLMFDQLIMEGTWVHISFDERMRRDVLTATFINGKANYSRGLS